MKQNFEVIFSYIREHYNINEIGLLGSVQMFIFNFVAV